MRGKGWEGAVRESGDISREKRLSVNVLGAVDDFVEHGRVIKG